MDTRSAQRDTKHAILLGLAGRCPHCGKGRLFDGGLRSARECSVCQEDLTPQRADDFPAYLVILVLGHLLVPIVVLVNMAWDLPLWSQMVGWCVLAVLIAVLMIRPAKGAVIGAQWALRMGGFAKQ
ncbi:DUF983 domain-containing protein [Sphingomonas sp. CGMCC 1.13654]|uniref:DUF983 domain-containing protein n=1 Tax=Sphingomonas chungangi TaxID=2683589 RepID=A0A838L924_9SPHN|nr:DUF983 domain-containing protein [Sphingomonas chungangi]MBA2934018.1 DUF983 domain-containing protein [Sphingomonas chungangi]MVW57764.1 DUF983 domain-containing protein [Sphingomonas chungangi]